MNKRIAATVTLLLFVLTPTASAAIPASERAALVALYNSTGGPSWTTSTNWLGAAGTECTWFGIRCDATETSVAGIFLANDNLTGTLPTQIGDFPNLTELELYQNQIGGSLPSQIGSLAKLQRLLLFDNKLTGSIPSSIGSLSQLVSTFLDRNLLSGSIPSTIGSLTNVETFHANGNQLTGALPSTIGSLSKLASLDLSFNMIGGSLPSTLGQLAALKELSLNSNAITGSIPPEISGAQKLEIIQLSTNQLTGTIPSTIGSMPNLVQLNLFNNQLTGAIPKELGNLPKIEAIELSQNQLTGAIPPELGRLVTLLELEAGTNQLSGTIPPELAGLVALERLQFDGNQLTGVIPPGLGKLSNLKVLTLNQNQLTGSIPREIGDLKKLTSFSVYGMALTGPIPSELTGLTELTELVLFGNQLTGSIPAGIGSLTKLTYLGVGGNLLTGTIPAEITNLINLTFLDLRGNNFTGTLPSDLGRLTALTYFSLEGNSVTGSLPTGIGSLTALETFRVDGNQLTGVIPPQIGQLTKVRLLLLSRNHFEGTIPNELFNLTGLTALGLGANKLGGALPASLGNLTSLVSLDLGNNQFRGEVPATFLNLTNLADGSLDIGFNALTTSNPALRTFLDSKQGGGDWLSTQTFPPTNVQADGSGVVQWTKVTYTADPGGYQVTATPATGSAVVATTASKELDSILLPGLQPGIYSVVVQTVTHPHGLQQNTITSDPTAPVTMMVTVGTPSFARVELSARPEGLVQVGGVASNQTSYALINSGTIATSITLGKSGAFFDQSPLSFDLAAGQTQIVTITSIAQPPGAYEGTSIPTGAGVEAGLTIPIRLVSSAAPDGSVFAQASSNRIDIAGSRSATTTGSVAFTNTGTATLTGVLVSDVPWLIPQSGLITINPGQTITITFTIDRSRRPDAAAQDGTAFRGELKLVYADNINSLTRSGEEPEDGPGTATSLVGIVDTVPPPVNSSSIPQLPPGQVALFIPGVRHQTRSFGELLSDLSIANSFAVAPLSDLRVFYSPSGAAASGTAASFNSIPPRGSLLLADAVKTVYGQGDNIGGLQIRSQDTNRILVSAKLLTVKKGKGSVGTSLPVFRSNRAALAGESVNLTGLRFEATESDLVVQETSGAGASVKVDFLSPSGAVVSTLEPSIDGYATLELRNAVPADAVTTIVTNKTGSAGSIIAYGLNADGVSGDTWVVADWARFYGYAPNQPVKVVGAVVADSSRRHGTRRGAKTSAGTEAAAPLSGIDLTLFNSGSAAANGTLAYLENGSIVAEQNVTMAARETRVYVNVVSLFLGRHGQSNGQIVFSPSRGSFAVTAHMRSGIGTDATGTTIPVLARTAALRLGQSQIFAGLEDARRATVDARAPGTFTTSVGFAESEGRSVTVRATMLFYDGRSLATSIRTRDFQVGPLQLLLIPNIARAIVGPERETQLGDLRDIQIELQVVSGSGAVTPFVTSTDNGSGDMTLRLE